MKRSIVFLTLLLAPALFTGSPLWASDIKARLNSSDGSTSLQILDSDDIEAGRIDSDGNLVILGSGTVNGSFIATGGGVGIGGGPPNAQFHVGSLDGAQGPQMTISTGTFRLFEVNGASVAARVGVHFPNGTSQHSAYIANTAGVVTLSSATSVGTLTSTSSLVSGGFRAEQASDMAHIVRVTSLSVIGTLHSTSALTGNTGTLSTLSAGKVQFSSAAIRGTVTSTSSIIASSWISALPSSFSNSVLAGSASITGSITSTGSVIAGAAVFRSVSVGTLDLGSVTFRGTLTSTSALISGAIQSSRPSTFSHVVEISSLSVTGSVTSTGPITGGPAYFTSLTQRSVILTGQASAVGSITSTSPAVFGEIDASNSSLFRHSVNISSLSVDGSITSTSPIRGNLGIFRTLFLNGLVSIPSTTILGTLTSTSALSVGGLLSSGPSELEFTRVASMTAIGSIVSTSPLAGRTGTFGALDLDGALRMSSMAARGTITSTSALVARSVLSFRYSEFLSEVQIDSLTVTGNMTSTDTVSGDSGVFRSLVINGEVFASSLTLRGTLTSSSPFLPGSIESFRPSTFTDIVEGSSIAVTGTLTSTNTIMGGEGIFSSILVRGPVVVASMTAAGTLTSTSALTSGGVAVSRPSVFLQRVQISSLSVVGTITSTSPISAENALLGNVFIAGGLRVGSMTSVGTLTSTSALIAGGVDVALESVMNGAVRVSSLAVTGEMTSTSAFITGGIEAEWESSFNGPVRISSLAVPGTLTTLAGFVSGRSSFTSIGIGGDPANFVITPAGRMGIKTNAPNAFLQIIGDAGSSAPQLLASTGANRLFEVTGESSTIDARLFQVTSTATHFNGEVHLATTAHITGPNGGIGNLLIVSTGTPGSSVRNAFLRVTSTGIVSVHGKGAFGTGGADVAEMYESDESLEPGDLVVAAGMGRIKKSLGLGSRESLLGIISREPGLVLGLDSDTVMENMKGVYPVALKGRTPVKASPENGPIAAGDFLAAAREPGRVAKAAQSGRIVGIALESWNGSVEPDRQVMAFMYQNFWVNPKEYEALSARVKTLESKLAEYKQ